MEDLVVGHGTAGGSASLSPPPLSPEPSLNPSLSTEPLAPSIAVPEEDDESLGLDPRLLSRREKSEVDRRVEALARELVSRDKSLTPLLDGWAGRSSMDMMEEIFPAYRQRSSWQRRRSDVSQEDRWGREQMAYGAGPLRREGWREGGGFYVPYITQ